MESMQGERHCKYLINSFSRGNKCCAISQLQVSQHLLPLLFCEEKLWKRAKIIQSSLPSPSFARKKKVHYLLGICWRDIFKGKKSVMVTDRIPKALKHQSRPVRRLALGDKIIRRELWPKVNIRLTFS